MSTNKNRIGIPITIKKSVGYSVIYKPRKAEKIIFPASAPIGSRLVIIGWLEICDYDHSAKFIKEGQSIVVETPFCFEGEPGKNKIDLTPEAFNTFIDSPEIRKAKIIPVYLSIDDIEELKSIDNLEENFNFSFIWKESSILPNLNEAHTEKVQSVKPFIAEADPKITFIPSESCLKEEGTNSYNVIYSPEDTDGYRFCLGNIVVRNLQKIRYKNPNGDWEKVSLNNLKVDLSYEHKENKHRYVGGLYLNESYQTSVKVEIPNGEDDISYSLFVDWEKWRNGDGPENIFLRVCRDDEEKPKLTCSFKMTPQFYDDVYALDLGTTGIVVAKEKDGKQEIIILDDVKSDQIEQEPEIISSLTMLTVDNDEGNSKMVLSPSANEYYGPIKDNKKRFRLVPSKFIIGQERIPYLKEFYLSDEINKKVDLFDLDKIDLVDTNTEKDNLKTISTVVGALYKSIFKRFSKETNQIKKLVITYPNTYTIENLDSIKSVLQDELNLNLNGQVAFVPESDAVAAYYFSQKIMYDGGFFDENGNIKKESNVVIYDMGAGTLDLSLIKFKQNADSSITASIVNKIGIPLAGNYLDYIIYNTLQCKNKIKNLEGKDNTIKDITKGIKCSYKESEDSIITSPPTWYVENQTDHLELKEEDSYLTLFKDSLNDFLECCSKTVLDLLIPEDTKVDTIVFSGRASKFSVLRDKVKESLRFKNSKVKEEELRPVANCGDHLKTCVAIGALKYQSFFNNNDLFKIENNNLYSKIAVVYWGRKDGRWGVCVEFLIDPHSEKEKNNKGEFINGTWCKEYSNNIGIKDFFPNKHLYYIQTNLDQKRIEELFTKVYQDDCLNEDDLNWAFVNVLFKYQITENKPFVVSLRISKDNKIIERRIGDKWLLDTKLMENIEDNILYRRSMWPFITKLKD